MVGKNYEWNEELKSNSYSKGISQIKENCILYFWEGKWKSLLIAKNLSIRI